jgi:predicted transcriptional regulator
LIAQILEAASDGSGATKTKIMYKAFLSYTQLKAYLAILVENGLLGFDSHEQIYKTTDKGLYFIGAYNQIGEYISNPMKTRINY